MPSIEMRDFSMPDETRSPERTTIHLVHLGDGEVGRYTFEPGWRWSECIKPMAKTESCQTEHIGYVISGQLRVKHDDGTEVELVPGMVYRIAPGHDGWTVGNEAAVLVEFQGAKAFAKA